jgi:hypothetical protein
MAARPIKFGTIVPQGWRLDLRHIDDQIEKYETMTRVAQEAERLGFDAGAGDHVRVLGQHGGFSARHLDHQDRADGHVQQLSPALVAG